MTLEQQLNANQNRRMASQDKFLTRINFREEKAEQMLGQLNNGKFYFYPVGGKYREGTRSELVAFIIRNQYA
jgi:hypothetical protein